MRVPILGTGYLAGNLPQCCQQAGNFFASVVMGQADAQEAAVFFYVEAFVEIQGVVVSVRGEEAVVAESSGEFERSVVCDTHGEGGTASAKLCGIGDAVKFE